tara:strand:+ start:128 stop:454 length:327 start_codon:yes stop_codon:yes gene_type:complete
MNQIINSLTNLNNYSEQNSDKLILIKFTASWCGPCQSIKPFIQSLLEQYSETIYLEVDVDQDEYKDIVEHFSVNAMPTFIFFKNAQTLKTIVGCANNDISNYFSSYYS